MGPASSLETQMVERYRNRIQKLMAGQQDAYTGVIFWKSSGTYSLLVLLLALLLTLPHVLLLALGMVLLLVVFSCVASAFASCFGSSFA